MDYEEFLNDPTMPMGAVMAAGCREASPCQ
jgi:hypothetical protein